MPDRHHCPADQDNILIDYVFLFSEEKIDQIDRTLARLSRLVAKLHADSPRLPILTDPTVASHAHMNSTVSPPRCSGPPDTLVIERDTRSPNHRAVAQPKDIAENEALIEGQSSLAAHSEFAIGFLHNVVGCHQAVGDRSEITGLLGTLRHMVDAFHHQRLSPKLLFPLAKSVTSRDHESCPMPPLEAAFAVIHEAQGYSFSLPISTLEKGGPWLATALAPLHVPDSIAQCIPSSVIRIN